MAAVWLFPNLNFGKYSADRALLVIFLNESCRKKAERINPLCCETIACKPPYFYSILFILPYLGCENLFFTPKISFFFCFYCSDTNAFINSVLGLTLPVNPFNFLFYLPKRFSVKYFCFFKFIYKIILAL